MFSGRIIFNFGIAERLRTLRYSIFTGGNSLSQSLTALPAPSGREPLARPGTLCFSRELSRHAKGPISEDDFPRPGEDVAQRQKGESVAVGDWGSLLPSLRTLPKKAGNISLSLREWGLFCIESRLQGAGGVCYTYGMEESNTTLQQRMEADPYEKTGKTDRPLLLTGALLLVLTACGAETEQQAKQRLLDEINSYRASLELDQLKEVKQLSAAEQELIEHFRAAGKTVLPESEGDEVLDSWRSKTKD